MARARIIRPEFFRCDRLAECEISARLLYIGLWMMANREGELQYRKDKIKAEIFPYYDLEIPDLIAQLENNGFLRLINHGSEWSIKLLNIGEYFVIPRKSKNRIGIPRWIRELVFNRDGEICAYCGAVETKFHLDHIFPLSRGGKNNPENLTVSCGPCNISKGAKLLEEWRPS